MATDEDELEMIRRRKMEELQRTAQERALQEQYKAQERARKQLILRQILAQEARERLARIELAYPELTESIENQLVALAQSGRVQEKIDDATLQQILRRIIPKKREIRIERR
jgi:programmed cell death protein 5